MPKTKTVKKAPAVDNTLDDLFLNKLKALYDIETQLVKALPKMAKNASDADLRSGFETHLRQTEGHVERIEKAFDALGQKPQKLACDGIRGLIADADWVIKNIKGDAALDANLIAAAQYVEHYEIAGYQSALQWANLLDQTDIADLLQQTLDEEQETSDELTDLAITKINESALPGGQRSDNESDKDEEESGEGDEEDTEDKNSV